MSKYSFIPPCVEIKQSWKVIFRDVLGLQDWRLDLSITNIVAMAHAQIYCYPDVLSCVPPNSLDRHKALSTSALRHHAVQLMDAWKWSRTCRMGCIECRRQRERPFPGYLPLYSQCLFYKNLFVCVCSGMCVWERKRRETKAWEERWGETADK